LLSVFSLTAVFPLDSGGHLFEGPAGSRSFAVSRTSQCIVLASADSSYRLDDLRQIDALTGSALGTAQRLASEISNAPTRALCPQFAQRMTIRLVIVASASAAADRALTVA